MAGWAEAQALLWRRRLPAFYAPGAGFLATFRAADLLTLRGHPSAGLGLGVMAGVVGLVGWCSPWLAALATGGIGWLMINGFVVDSYGVLRWHGTVDMARLALLVGCGVAACGTRTSLSHLARWLKTPSTMRMP